MAKEGYKEFSQADEISESIAQSVSKFTGKKVKSENILHFKPRDKSKDN